LKSNKSHLSILTTAKSLFWKYGIRRVSVEEICKEAGVSKMTFYRLFSNKVEVAKAVLVTVMNENMDKYRNIMLQDISFTEKINQLIKLKYDGTLEMSQEFFSEVYQTDEMNLRELLVEYQKNGLDAFMADLKNAQEQGWIKEGIKPEFILYILNKINEMLLDKNLTSIYTSTHEAIMALTNFFFYGIIQKRH
jgi:AcrR family transcriptional regulator